MLLIAKFKIDCVSVIATHTTIEHHDNLFDEQEILIKFEW
jgi:hypothetical protein